MKDNILNKFALRDLKKHKKDTIAISLTILIISLIMMFISWITPVFLYKNYLDYHRQYGKYTYYGMFGDDEDLNHIQPVINGKTYQLDDLDVCYEYVQGETFTNSVLMNIEGNVDLLPIELIEGRFPQNENEITLSKTELKSWGYEEKLNQEIEIAYFCNEKAIKKKYEVVGFIEASDETDNIDFLKCCLIKDKDKTYSYGNVYIHLDNNQQIENSEELNLSNTSLLSFQVPDYDRNTFLMFIQVMITIISVAILYGITMAGLESKIKDYTLLRGMGMTNRQMNYIVLLQTLIISLLPSLIAMFIIFILSRIVTSYNDIPLPFDLATMLMELIVVLVITLFSYFLPARKSLKRALTGSFDNQEHQYIYYRYKKLHKLNAFYLGYRQLMGVKRKSITRLILLFIATLFISSYIYPYFYPQENKRISQDINMKIYYYIDDSDKSDILQKEDFEIYKPYASQILYTKILDSYDIKIFPYNDDTQQYYQLDNLKNGEAIVSNTYLENQYKAYQEGDEIIIDEQTFIIKGIIKNNESICFVNEADFSQFNLENYLYVKIDFDNVSQRTAAFLNNYQEIGELKYTFYGQYWFDDEDIFEYDNNIIKPNLYDLLIGCVALFIFVYQYIFELFKQKEDIGSFQLLGFTKKEIGSIYFFKSLMIMSISFIIATLYQLEDIYRSYNIAQVLKIFKVSVLAIPIFVVLMIMIIICLVSLLPIVIILNNSGLENKVLKE